MLNTNSDTLRRVVQVDLNLQPRSSACWTAQLLSAFQGLRGCELYVRAVQTGHAITMQEFTADLKHRMRGVWKDAELVDPTRTTTNWPPIILGLSTISGKQRIGFGAAAGAQQLYSSITQAST
jgi:hypothetical protein